MDNEQALYWLKGYISDKTELSKADVDLIVGTLKVLYEMPLYQLIDPHRPIPMTAQKPDYLYHYTQTLVEG